MEQRLIRDKKRLSHFKKWFKSRYVWNYNPQHYGVYFLEQPDGSVIGQYKRLNGGVIIAEFHASNNWNR